MSVVELMVGITIGLFILAGATTVATTQLGDSKRLMLEAQVQQDLRLTMDIMTRDLRRAGYWGRTDLEVWPQTINSALVNPYSPLTSTSSSIQFIRSTDEDTGLLGTAEDTAVGASEYGGFRYNSTDQTLEMRIGGANTWQTLTDRNVLLITGFTVALNQIRKPVDGMLGVGNCPLNQTISDADIQIQARATHDAAVTRTLRATVRLRNDLVGC